MSLHRCSPLVVLSSASFLICCSFAEVGGTADPGGETPPPPAGKEICGNGLDDDGDGQIDGQCACAAGAEQGCFPGDPALRGVGQCQDGRQLCGSSGGEFGSWSACEGAVLPSTEVCGDGIDQDCDGADLPCDAPPPEPGPGEQEACGNIEESAIFVVLNETRAEQGLSPLACDAAALQAARAHSQHMCDNNIFTDELLDGRTFRDLLQEAGASFGEADEIIAYGFVTPEQLRDGWLSAPDARATVYGSAWRRAAVGVVNCPGQRFHTALFLD